MQPNINTKISTGTEDFVWKNRSLRLSMVNKTGDVGS